MTNETTQRKIKPMQNLASALERAISQKAFVRISLEEFFEGEPRVCFYKYFGGADDVFRGGSVLDYDPANLTAEEEKSPRSLKGILRIGGVSYQLFDTTNLVSSFEKGIRVSGIVGPHIYLGSLDIGQTE